MRSIPNVKKADFKFHEVVGTPHGFLNYSRFISLVHTSTVMESSYIFTVVNVCYSHKTYRTYVHNDSKNDAWNSVHANSFARPYIVCS